MSLNDHDAREQYHVRLFACLNVAQAKELFYLLDDRREGCIRLDDLLIELRSGGISPEHETLILNKFTEKGRDVLDFLFAAHRRLRMMRCNATHASAPLTCMAETI